MARGVLTRTACLAVHGTVFTLLVWSCCAITTEEEVSIIAARERDKGNGESLNCQHAFVPSSLVFKLSEYCLLVYCLLQNS